MYFITLHMSGRFNCRGHPWSRDIRMYHRTSYDGEVLMQRMCGVDQE